VFSPLRRFVVAIVFVIAAIVTPARAQQVPVRDLPKPAQELEDPFTLITGAVELQDGKIVVVDGGEAVLAVIDFAKGSRTDLGRRGSGPGEYSLPAGLFKLRGDTLWVLDAMQQRIVAFLPDLKPGTTFPFLTFDASTSTALSAPFYADRRGFVYANAMAIQGANMGARGGSFQLPDSVGLTRVDPRDKSRSELARVRFPTSGKPEMKVDGANMKFTMNFPGLVASDPWAVFPDGRVAIVRGAPYTVEFITPDGKKSAPFKIAYDRIRVTEADRKAEMDEAKQQMEEQSKAAKKMMPANINMTFELNPPAGWPAEYPSVSPMGALAAPDGRLWIKRAIPTRVGREQWDVVDPSGKLVARWQTPAKVNLVAVGSGVVYTVRKDEDDLRYVQRVVIPR
jgi:hypothetical protein